ncbi:MAG TPA: SpoIIE family protein phosphatase [Vicinamibacterales bacterium]|nr:SpoIIE family protein phosphatase [Vicinamibacterales bacterium]
MSPRPGDIIRAIPALWIAAIALKVLVWLAAPANVAIDRAVNLVIIGLAATTIYRVAMLARSGLLWRVSRKLILSYVLVGAVPILLLVTFTLVAFLLLFFDFSAYLVHDRVAHLTEQATLFGRTTLFELERGDQSEQAEIIQRRESALGSRYPGIVITVAQETQVPTWVSRAGFAGLVERGTVARAVTFSRGSARRYAVVVDLPVDSTMDEAALAEAGITLGEQREPSLFNTATYVAYVDWETGAPAETHIAMAVDVRRLYSWMGGNRKGEANINFNRILLYMLVGIGVLLCVIEAVALSNGLALARTITTSVDELFSGTERVKSGNFERRIAVRSDDQLGQLATSFNDMTARIQHLLVEQDVKRRLEQELQIARDIQMSLLPHNALNAPGMSVAALCAPAREVGGDYYDFLPLADGRVGMLIADVSGKGTSAALYMAELKGLMLSLSRIHTSPRALLIEANDIIKHHLDSRSFITMTYVVIDRAAGTLTCARAGHTPFMRIAAGDPGARCLDVFAPDGMVLGLNLDRGERFERCLEELTLPIAAGDLFFFFTDGLSEAMAADGSSFGEDRLGTVLAAHADLAPEALRDQLMGDVAAFVHGQPQHDDITMVILKIERVERVGESGESV